MTLKHVTTLSQTTIPHNQIMNVPQLIEGAVVLEVLDGICWNVSRTLMSVDNHENNPLYRGAKSPLLNAARDFLEPIQKKLEDDLQLMVIDATYSRFALYEGLPTTYWVYAISGKRHMLSWKQTKAICADIGIRTLPEYYDGRRLRSVLPHLDGLPSFYRSGSPYAMLFRPKYTLGLDNFAETFIIHKRHFAARQEGLHGLSNRDSEK